MKRKIMVVDDNPDILYSVRNGLETLDPDMSVMGVSSGKECLDTVKDVKPELILMDIMMPGMDGWDTVAKLKTDKSTADIPIIFLTGKGDPFSKSMGTLTSADYIVKPFHTVDLRDRILKALKK
jgi:CheY-like chemotaxis protein